ncbi:hypothetical protein K1241_002419 [Escherichia coli]|uniref:hypothetical protein n=1 Tax=Escherichia coli TaxID=562 RepID=UPI000BE7D36C|nr:hypothetical protein [Escherichia coli]EEX2506194.1 hypothetical protein [Escherichia coli]EFC0791776.1 hypothetical protein [Escherichia coli]EFE8096183.1 hypothetical protein [Escherichia coli]EFJ0489498.1 hypothetical protein [Escherichia coli]EFJ3310788.1 hypothetical protein [Escherichia coli]
MLRTNQKILKDAYFDRGRDLAKLCAALKEISQYFTDIEDDIANKGASISLANRAHFMGFNVFTAIKTLKDQKEEIEKLKYGHKAKRV